MEKNSKLSSGVKECRSKGVQTIDSSASNSATWIWYPGDFEIWMGNIFNNRRTERGAMFPPFWKQDSHWQTVEFSKAFTLDQEETINIRTEGNFNLMLDGKLQFGMPETFVIPAGEHKLNLKVWNVASPPALFIDGKTIKTDSTWLATYEDKIWIDENGVAHGSGIYVPAASWDFNSPNQCPSKYKLKTRRQQPVVETTVNDARLFDFGKETFGYLNLIGIKGSGIIYIYYGESKEEALDFEHCETLDVITIPRHSKGGKNNRNANSLSTRQLVNSSTNDIGSKAFRFVCIKTEGSVRFATVNMDYEYSPYDNKKSGSFKCNDQLLNNIWKVAAYTMDLTTREFFVDGIKRDRWTWSGDAIQSYLMNYYLRFDSDCVRRTIRQLRGKDPVTAHINTIMDYTFYWFKSVYDFYVYTADINFVREIYPRMQTMMDYVLGRTNGEGMAEGKHDDWIFVDWVDFPMHKRGTLCFEQILLCKSLETMKTCATVLRDNPLAEPPQGSITTDEYNADAEKYGKLEEALRSKLKPTFWNEEQQAFMHAIEDGEMNAQITKFPNMFAIIYDYLSDDDKQKVMQSAMLNPDVPAITTPYMRFYELEALCQMGMQKEVLKEMRNYWGGMLQEGATSFWEKYNPEETGIQHLTMYGRPYGKSLCHAWGASPIYLLGKYYLGVQPTKAGYEEYTICPVLGDLEWMEGKVPTPHGPISIRADRHSISILAPYGKGRLLLNGKEYEIKTNEKFEMSF